MCNNKLKKGVVMSRPVVNYKITPAAKKRFKKWLFDNELTITSFARRCGVSRQYIDSVVKGKNTITPTVIAWFKKGGYELL